MSQCHAKEEKETPILAHWVKNKNIIVGQPASQPLTVDAAVDARLLANNINKVAIKLVAISGWVGLGERRRIWAWREKALLTLA